MDNKEFLKLVKKYEDKYEKVVENDYYRQNYHLMCPVGFMNDPNGFIDFQGEYHLFYQYNPAYPEPNKIVCWGHVKSKDLVNWDRLPPALAPIDWYDSQGCYSGSAVNVNDELVLVYTGNVKDIAGNRETYQCLAKTLDGVSFEKDKKNPVISNQPEGYTRHFRDPKIWQHNDFWYAIIGAQTEEKRGAAVIYSSKDLYSWNKIGEAAGANLGKLSFLGYMWECPNLFSIKNKDILLFCPQGVKAEGDFYNNIYQCGYLTGKLDYNTGKMSYSDFTEFDRGFEFYAPQVTKDSKGRTLVIGWMGLPDEENSPTIEKHWLHCLTIIRELQLKGNKIIQKPVEEMRLLRKDEMGYDGIILNNEEIQLKNIEGDSYELLCEFFYENVQSFGLKLRCNKDKKEETLFYYDSEEEKLVLDRSKDGFHKDGVRKCKVKASGKLKLNVFMDKSSVEIFVNDGQEVFTSRIYPSKGSNDVIFFAQNGEVSLNVRHWTI
ncbi:glycoside hydrolase family 32 protein [Clostridium neuense]|uniref:Sucrose-6-phosphate hydrolase n=1 Tax=Clostridium neuense TaxID=1728934 RepID=A0ABW8THP5_9CLOT